MSFATFCKIPFASLTFHFFLSLVAAAVKSLRSNEYRGSNAIQLMCREAMMDRSPAFMRVSLASAAWIAITVLASGCNKTPSSVPNSVTRQMNAIGAGSELPDGWVLARSSSANFSVLLPGKYNDFQQSARTVVGNQLTTHTVGLTTKAGLKYSVTAFEGGDPKPADEFLAGIITTFEKSGSIEERHDLELEGQPGIQLVVTGPQSTATVRAFAFPGMTYLLIAEYPPNAETSVLADVARFFESFETGISAQ